MSTDTRWFNAESQSEFARISCDINPIHCDSVEARRTPVGAPIVHGIHCLIWILDSFARSELWRPGANVVRVKFLQPIYVGETVTLEIGNDYPNSVRASARIGLSDVVLVTIEFEKNEVPCYAESEVSIGHIDPPHVPMDLTLDEMRKMSGVLSFGAQISDLGAMYPAACQAFGLHRIGALACASCLVGMVVPGLHSLFLALEVSLADKEDGFDNSLHFAVKSVTPRARLLSIFVESRGIRGTVEVLSRMPPVQQPTINRVMSLVPNGAFRGSTALVIGGSRGLGELVAKIVAAGGADVTLTYSEGRFDGERVGVEISRMGLRSAVVQFNSLRPVLPQIVSIGVIPTHVYYFATPPIARRKSGVFDLKRFAEFESFYITSFHELVLACMQLRPSGVKVFFPSTQYIDMRPPEVTEYAMAKAAAEVLCRDLCRFMPNARIFTKRLPRLLTDQTNSAIRRFDADAVEVLLPIVNEMHS